MAKVGSYPEEGEFVVVNVKKVKNFGAFVTLDEYEDKEGFIHIAEVAAGWVKYIRDHVREGQRVVCKVLKVDPGKNHIDLSLKHVNEHQRREKIQQWKNEKKALKLLEIIAEKSKKDIGWVTKNIREPMVDRYGGLYLAFEQCVMDPEGFKEEWSEAWVDDFIAIAQENIVLPYVSIKGRIEMTCAHREGIRHIIDALKEADRVEVEDAKVETRYIGAPRYEVAVTAPDYKTAEEALKMAADNILDYIAKYDGEGKFFRRD